MRKFATTLCIVLWIKMDAIWLLCKFISSSKKNTDQFNFNILKRALIYCGLLCFVMYRVHFKPNLFCVVIWLVSRELEFISGLSFIEILA